MSASYQQLLEATVQHLQELKAEGSRFVNVSPATLQALRAAPTAPARPVSAARPAAISPPTASSAPGRGAGVEVSSSHLTIQPFNDATGPKAAPPGMATPPLAPARPIQQFNDSTIQPKSIATPTSSSKAAALDEIRQRAMACMKCTHLAESRTNVVFGVGNPEAEVMFVGEAPGADEDQQGEPFVGAAGQLLTKMILAMGLTREQVYIANILKCRPDMPAGSSGNRPPKPEEMETCIPYLHAQIDVIKPKVLVGLGATAIQGLLGKTGISKLRGTWHTYRDIPLMPTYHPAYLLRNQAMSEKRRVWEDLLAVMEKAGLPINEKQRNYFLPKA